MTWLYGSIPRIERSRHANALSTQTDRRYRSTSLSSMCTRVIRCRTRTGSSWPRRWRSFASAPRKHSTRLANAMEVSRVFVGNQSTRFEFDPKDGTILVVPLNRQVPPGGEAVAVIDFSVDLPEKWGRWGNYQGVTYLLNWYPVLAHHDDKGWERTPFVPWHQPWYQEAGHYTVVVDLPAGQVVASSGRITDRHWSAGWQRLTIKATPARDFALVCSNRFQSWERTVGAPWFVCSASLSMPTMPVGPLTTPAR